MATAAVVHQPEGSRPSAALVFETPKDARRSLLQLGSVLAPLLPQGVSIQAFASSVYFYMLKQPTLAQCTTPSLLESFQKAAQSGLVLGETCHILPFGKTATFVSDWKGLAQKMIASGCVRAVDARVVRNGDRFEYENGLNERLSHVVQGDKNRPITHAYVILKLPRGEKTFLVMAADEIEAIRQTYSRSNKAGPLLDWYAKKTVVRQIAKTIPDPRLIAQMRMLEQVEEIEAEALPPRGAQVAIPAQVDDDDTPVVHGRPGQQFDTDPLREAGDERPVREYRAPRPTAHADGPEAYDEMPDGRADLEARRATLRGQIAEAAQPLAKQVRETIAYQASQEPDVGALGVILEATRAKSARRAEA